MWVRGADDAPDIKKPEANKPEEVKPDEAQGTSPDYVLQPSDLIRVTVFQEEDLTNEVRLSQESKVYLNLIGYVDLKDKTIRQARELIRELYDKDYLVNPRVSVSVMDYSKRAINVLGAVGSPGPIFFPAEEGLDLLQAITRAGGLSRLADKKRVKLIRVKPDGTSEITVYNFEKILNAETKDNPQLQKGDTINVPERLL